MSVLDHSIESGPSSLQRSGLSITIGDTKSIVLALQALQTKIRNLEEDRDHHQDRYEKALHAHEQYKLDMEQQMKKERLAHHSREQELVDHLRKAREERAELEAALQDRRDHIGSMRSEVEQMIATEKELTQQKETRLEAEVGKLQKDIKEEQTRRAALQVMVEKLRKERETAIHSNEELRLTIDDLLSRYEQLQARRTAAATEGRTSRATSANSRKQTSTLAGVSPRRTYNTRRVAGGTQPSYADPTCCSILRDIRVDPEEQQAAAVSSPLTSLNDTEVRDSRVHKDNGNCSCVSCRSLAAHRLQRVTPSSSRRRGTKKHPLSRPVPFLGIAAMNEVEQQLEAELRDLQRQYDDTIRRGSSEPLPPQVLTVALQRISGLVEQKKEQLRLIKEARIEVENVSGGGNATSPCATAKNGFTEEDRLTRRTMLVNELRSLLSEASGHA